MGFESAVGCARRFQTVGTLITDRIDTDLMDDVVVVQSVNRL
nr:hypothetical protein [Natrarchaeobius chitinivorans]